MKPHDAPISLVGREVFGSKTPFAASTIMIVDDEPTTIDILEMFLQGEGYEQFITTTDSTHAVEMVQKHRPDVLLLDWMMPGVNGMDVLAAIREDGHLKHTPVIILTSSTDGDTKLQALEIGATDFLGKPVDPSELALRLRNTLAAKNYTDRLVNYDSVTGLPNRNLFMDRLQRMLARASALSLECAVLHVGIDRFQKINDTLGYGVGDALLKAISERLENAIRPTDFLGIPGGGPIDDPFARIGADEFAMLLPGIGTMERAASVAGRILKHLAEPFNVIGHDLFVTASIGIALFPQDGAEVEAILAGSTIATAHAKERGGNRLEFYDATLDSQAAGRLSLEADLRRAAEREQLQLYFQPKFDVGTGRLVGAEALMRWNHPKLGLVEPDRFIPIAEETGLIELVGEWALHAGCQQNQAWLDAGLPPLVMAINVSARQFQDVDLVEKVRGALERSSMAPGQLILELTESTLMGNPADAVRMLDSIKAMGVRTSIDDFGTGYSSLSFLKRFPLDELKIDRSFVQHVPRDEDDVAIVSAIIHIGHAMGMTVVAEGVETNEQLDFLAARGCNSFQGFLRSKPLPADQFEALLRAEI